MVYLFKKNETYLSLDYAMFPYYKEVTRGDILTGYMSKLLLEQALDEVREKIMTSRYADVDDEKRREYLLFLDDILLVFMDVDSYLEMCQENGFLVDMEGNV